MPMNPGYYVFNLIMLAVAGAWLLLVLRRSRMRRESLWNNPSSMATLLGVSAGLLMRLSFSALHEADVMSIGFLFGVPVVTGYVTVACAAESQQPRLQAIFLPWGTALSTMLIAGLIGFEGLICIIMAFPI